MTAEPDWRTIAGDLAASLLDFNHHWADETRGSMYRYAHKAMIAYYEAIGFDWRKWVRDDLKLPVCECHADPKV